MRRGRTTPHWDQHGYAPDKNAVAVELAAAARDPDGGVRNDATRSLWAIAQLAATRPDLGLFAGGEMYVDMLNSVVWSDRNKAAFVLDGLTENGGVKLLVLLRERALESLSEMAQWKSEGHALSAVKVLGRIAGWSDQRTLEAWGSGRRAEIIDAARRSPSEAAAALQAEPVPVAPMR